MPQPKLDEALVEHLAKIASKLDGGHEENDRELLAEFNRLAGTEIPFSEFQGIYSAEEHFDYVRRVLTAKATAAQPDLDRDGLIEMFTKIDADPCDDAYLSYVFARIKKTFGDDKISDLVFWPNLYFGEGNKPKELTPEVMADAVLDRYKQRMNDDSTETNR